MKGKAVAFFVDGMVLEQPRGMQMQEIRARNVLPTRARHVD